MSHYSSNFVRACIDRRVDAGAGRITSPYLSCMLITYPVGRDLRLGPLDSEQQNSKFNPQGQVKIAFDWQKRYGLLQYILLHC